LAEDADVLRVLRVLPVEVSVVELGLHPAIVTASTARVATTVVM
jgi:hypothetical protein